MAGYEISINGSNIYQCLLYVLQISSPTCDHVGVI